MMDALFPLRWNRPSERVYELAGGHVVGVDLSSGPDKSVEVEMRRLPDGRWEIIDIRDPAPAP